MSGEREPGSARPPARGFLEAARRWLPWLPAVALMALIFALSSVSGLRVSDDPEVDRPARTLAHLGTYALLAAFLLHGLAHGRAPRRREVALAFGGAVLYGLSDEIHQAFVPGRTGRADDLLVDAAGALVGAVSAAVLLRQRPFVTEASEPPDRGDD